MANSSSADPRASVLWVTLGLAGLWSGCPPVSRQALDGHPSWPGSKSASVLAAPAYEGDFTLTSYLQSDVQIAYSALSSNRQEGGVLNAAEDKQLTPTPKLRPQLRFLDLCTPRRHGLLFFHPPHLGESQTSKGSWGQEELGFPYRDPEPTSDLTQDLLFPV